MCGDSEEKLDAAMIDLHDWFGRPTCWPCVEDDQNSLHSRGIEYIANPRKWSERILK